MWRTGTSWTIPAAIKIGQQLQLHIPVAGSAPKDVPRPVMASQVPEQGGTKSYPKVGKLAYTEQALAQAERLQNESAGGSGGDTGGRGGGASQVHKLPPARSG